MSSIKPCLPSYDDFMEFAVNRKRKGGATTEPTESEFTEYQRSTRGVLRRDVKTWLRHSGYRVDTNKDHAHVTNLDWLWRDFLEFREAHAPSMRTYGANVSAHEFAAALGLCGFTFEHYGSYRWVSNMKISKKALAKTFHTAAVRRVSENAMVKDALMSLATAILDDVTTQ